MKTKKMTLLAIALALTLGLNSCFEDFSIHGNGDEKTETRGSAPFDEVKSSGSFEVLIVPGDEYLVEVTAESNLLPYIVTDVDSKKLKIHTRGVHNLHNNTPMRISITTPQLAGINLSGSGYIETEHFTGNDFDIDLSGSGQIETAIDMNDLNAQISGSGKIILSGLCNHSDLKISGSGKIHSYNLEQNSCHATISGSGDIYVNVKEQIDVEISGSGDLFYMNSPEVHSNISGSGKVINDN